MTISKSGQFQINNSLLAPAPVAMQLLRMCLQISGLLSSWQAGGRGLFFLVIFMAGSFFPAYSQSTVKIGFLIRDKADLAITEAAELAIKKANEDGGYKGQDFELVIRSCDGPWGITSKQAVELIHEQEVPILVTALDGRNAHLAEQVVAKSHVVMLSTLSSDPTLSRAYVPWYYRLIPDDRQQSIELVADIYKAKNHRKVVVLALDNYDGKMSAEAFADAVQKQKLPVPEIVQVGSQNEILKALQRDEFQSAVLAGTAGFDLDVFPVGQSVYAFLNCFNFVDANDLPENATTIHVLSSELDSSSNIEKSEHIFGSPSLVYVYDGISLAVEAIRKLGPDPNIIRAEFGDLTYEGITGIIKFDSMGNRKLE